MRNYPKLVIAYTVQKVPLGEGVLFPKPAPEDRNMIIGAVVA